MVCGWCVDGVYFVHSRMVFAAERLRLKTKPPSERAIFRQRAQAPWTDSTNYSPRGRPRLDE